MTKKKKLIHPFIIVGISAIILACLPFNISALKHFDKIVHLTIFFLISLFINRTFEYGSGLISALFTAILFGFGVELLQEHIPGRQMDIIDALVNTLGIVIGSSYHNRQHSITNKTSQ